VENGECRVCQAREAEAPARDQSEIGDSEPPGGRPAEHDRTDGAGKLIERWLAMEPGEEFDMAAETTDATARVVCRTMFSMELGAESDIVLNASTKYQKSLCHVDYAEMLGLPEWMGGKVTRKMRRAVRYVDSVVIKLIQDRLTGDEKGDFISVLVKGQLEKNNGQVNVREVRDQVTVMLLAGHETTANLLAWCLYLVSQDPGVAERLHEEATAVIGDRPAELEDIPNLPFTVAVLEETMRLYPSIPVLWRNAVDEDEIAGKRIEPGSNVIVSPWLIHRNRMIWQQANRFVPERMLKENRVGRDRYAFIPFGAGPRVCIGANFAMHEATIMLSTIMRTFKVRLREGYQPIPLARFTLRPHPRLPMTLERW